MIMSRGVTTVPLTKDGKRLNELYMTGTMAVFQASNGDLYDILPPTGDWAEKAPGKKFHQVKMRADGRIVAWMQTGDLVRSAIGGRPRWKKVCQRSASGLRTGRGGFNPIGSAITLASGQKDADKLNPISYLATLQGAEIETWSSVVLADGEGLKTTVYYPDICKHLIFSCPAPVRRSKA